jgi:hypothetical protein
MSPASTVVCSRVVPSSPAQAAERRANKGLKAR